MKIDQKIEELMKQRIEIEVKIKKLRLLNENDCIEVRKNRWGREYFYSPNDEKCNKVEFRYTCGCCYDAGYLAKPYYEKMGNKIYGNDFEVGEGKYETFYSYNDLEEKLNHKKINDKLKKEIKEHVKRKEADKEYSRDFD